MQIVIEIDEDLYEMCRDSLGDEDNIEGIIANGTPLPKGHGRIIDESQVTGTFTWDNGFIECFAPTIIEADTESEDGE